MSIIITLFIISYFFSRLQRRKLNNFIIVGVPKKEHSLHDWSYNSEDVLECKECKLKFTK